MLLHARITDIGNRRPSAEPSDELAPNLHTLTSNRRAAMRELLAEAYTNAKKNGVVEFEGGNDGLHRKPVFCLPDGRRISSHPSKKARLIRNLDDLQHILDF